MHLIQRITKQSVVVLSSFLLLFTFAFALQSASVSALDPVQEACAGPGAGSDVCGGGGDNPLVGPNGVITRVTNIISIITGMVALIVIILSGLLYARSGGNSGQLSQARDAIIYAGVALAVAALAQVIVRFVLSSLQ